jgi:vitamin B12/bleomycin/antimicrobial peptide transport system ATP-binding/permease protein
LKCCLIACDRECREERSAKILFAIVIILTFLSCAVSVWFSYLGRDFTAALTEQKPELYYYLLAKYAVAVFFVGVPIAVLHSYYKDKLSLEWRSWMTLRALDMYQSDKR